jgi:hypothetical protein
MGARCGLQANWPTITNEYWRGSLQAMLNAEHLTCTILHPVGVRGVERFAKVMEALRR